MSLFEINSPKYDVNKTNSRGKIFTLCRDMNDSGKIDIEDLEWEYLEGDGDFRSDEVKALRDEADIIITNPPFSLFREFISWILEAEKKFIIIGNVGAVSYKEIFPLMKDNKMWMGVSIHSGDRKFVVPNDYPLNAAGCGIDENGNKFIRVKGVRWFTNVQHGRRHQHLQLMTMSDNIKYSNHKQVRNNEYKKYDNYDAIDIPFTDAIPNDYDGVMGVPITFLDVYNPEQFEILGYTEAGNELCTKFYTGMYQHKNGETVYNMKSARYAPMISHLEEPDTNYYTMENAEGYLTKCYTRIFIRRK
jgi:hypothetical protein